MSDTPRTDKYGGYCAEYHKVDGMTLIEHARQLELEVAELKKENKKLLDKISLLKTDYLVLDGEYFAKLDELEEENADLKRMLSNVIDT